MNNNQLDISAIDNMRDDIIALLDDLEFEKMKEQVGRYNDTIKQTLLNLPESPLNQKELLSVQQLLVQHQKLVKGFEYKRQNVLDELKKLKRGQAMQKAYPKT